MAFAADGRQSNPEPHYFRTEPMAQAEFGIRPTKFLSLASGYYNDKANGYQLFYPKTRDQLTCEHAGPGTSDLSEQNLHYH